MAVKVGHARISETGKIYGKKGDQTTTEVCVTNWVNPGWGFMAIHPDPAVRELHAQCVEKGCANNNIGYSQYERNTLYTEMKKVGNDLSRVALCNTDCSAFQNACALAAKTPKVTYASNGWTTSTMRSALKDAGYKILTSYLTEAYAVRGAIYVKPGEHTVCALNNGSKYTQTLKAAGLSDSAPSGNGNTSYVGKGIAKGTALMSMGVRTGPGTNYSKIGEVPAGKDVEILEQLSSGWMKIVWPGAAEGYAYTSARSESYYRITYNKPKTGKVVNCYHLAVRNAPSGDLTSTLDRGREVTIVGECGKWLQITSPKKGWVSGTYIQR